MANQDELFGEDESCFVNGMCDADLEALEKLKDLSIQAYDHANLAGINCTAQVKAGLYVRKVLDAAAEAAGKTKALGKDEVSIQLAAREAADRAALDRGDPLVEAVLTASYKAGWETHRIMGFLRFVPVELNPKPASDEPAPAKENMVFYLARCAPDHFILPALAGHFALRFGEKPWAIIDEKRNCILIRRPGKEPSLEELNSEDAKAFRIAEDPGSNSDRIEDLWRLYHKSVLIENRKNLRLQRQFVPLRYRKYLTEFKTD